MVHKLMRVPLAAVYKGLDVRADGCAAHQCAVTQHHELSQTDRAPGFPSSNRDTYTIKKRPESPGGIFLVESP